MSDLFEKAARLKLRFATPVGELAAEQLFELPLTSARPNIANLNDIAVAYHHAAKAADEVSFVNPKPKAGNYDALRLDIVKRVIEIKQDENAKKLAAGARRDEIQKLQSLVAEKKDGALAAAPLADLEARLAALLAGSDE